MNVKSWLNRAKNIDRKISSLIKEKDEEKARVMKITQTYTADVVQGTRDPHRYDRLVEYEQEIDAWIDELLKTKAEIVREVRRLKDGRYQEILLLRYIEGLTFEEISVRIKYSYVQTCRLHGRALIKMEEVLNELNADREQNKKQ